MTDGCTKIDAPMMMPTTSAVACSGVIDRESMAAESRSRGAPRPEARAVVSDIGRETVRLRGRLGLRACAPHHMEFGSAVEHGVATRGGRVSCAVGHDGAPPGHDAACPMLFFR